MDGLYAHLQEKCKDPNIQKKLVGEEYDSESVMEDAAIESTDNTSNMSNISSIDTFYLIREYVKDQKCMYRYLLAYCFTYNWFI